MLKASDKRTITVVIPATKECVRVVNSIFRAIMPSHHVRVIVVMNNCPLAEVERMKSVYGSQCKGGILKIIHLPNSTIGGARNEGIRNANGRYIVHLDSDCIVPTSYFKNLFAEIASNFEIGRGMVRFVGSGSFLDRGNCTLKASVYLSRKEICYTPNLIVKTEIHQALMFDEQMFRGEDTEFSIRAKAAGLRPIFLPNLLAIHQSDETTTSIVSKYFHYGIARVYRFLKWKPVGENTFFFYRRLFGEIPPLMSFSTLNERATITILYLVRDIGVLYGLLKEKFV